MMGLLKRFTSWQHVRYAQACKRQRDTALQQRGEALAKQVVAEAKLAIANAAIAALQLAAEKQRQSDATLLAAVKAAHLRRVDALELELEQVKARADEDHAELSGRLSDAARRLRLAEKHLLACPTAEAVRDHDSDKARENAQ